MKDDRIHGGFTPGRATRFYVPLLVQAFSQSLTYPLVAAIVSHGPYGVGTLAAFAQGQTVMFLIGAFGAALVTTGMVFARTVAGYRNFIQLNTWMTAVLVAIQALAAMPPFDALIFRDMLNLPPDLAETARLTLLWGIPLQATFFLRNVPLVILFNARASAAANNATFIRILFTLVASWLFVRIGWTGAMWGLVAMTVPCFAELAFTYIFARPYIRELLDDGQPESVATQFRFTLPLALGGLLLAAAPFMVAAFVGRTENAVAMLAIHYVTIGLANAIGYAALRMQAVAIEFPAEYEGDNRTFRYAVYAGLTLGLILVIAVLPGIGTWYFHTVQSLPLEDLGKSRLVMLIYAIWPVIQTIRGHAEGTAAVRKRPVAVLLGQIAYLSTLVAMLATSLKMGMPGWAMGVSAIIVATAVTAITVYACMWRAGRLPPPPARRRKRACRTNGGTVATHASTSEMGIESQMPNMWSANTCGSSQMHGSRHMN